MTRTTAWTTVIRTTVIRVHDILGQPQWIIYGRPTNTRFTVILIFVSLNVHVKPDVVCSNLKKD